MRCNAMLFNLERIPSTRKPGVINNFLTFVDVDTGESFRTYVDESQAAKYAKLRPVDIELSLSMGEYQGKPQLNVKVLSINEASAQTSEKSESKPASPLFGKTGTSV